MTKLEAQNLKANDRVIDTRDGCKATVDAWDETVHLLQRRGYGKANYVPGKALYYLSEVAK
jgi:hypothetical protein